MPPAILLWLQEFWDTICELWYVVTCVIAVLQMRNKTFSCVELNIDNAPLRENAVHEHTA